MLNNYPPGMPSPTHGAQELECIICGLKWKESYIDELGGRFYQNDAVCPNWNDVHDFVFESYDYNPDAIINFLGEAEED